MRDYLFRDRSPYKTLNLFQGLKCALFLVNVKVCLRTRYVHCYSVHTKIATVHACTQYVHVIVVFVDAQNLHFNIQKLQCILRHILLYFFCIE